MISAVESINELVRNELIGATCYVKCYDGTCDAAIITKLHLYVSNRGIGVKAHLKSENYHKRPDCVTLEGYDYDVCSEPVGFLTPMSYAKFYSNQG